jgi:hypothetical protein
MFVACLKFRSTYQFELNEDRTGFRLANSLIDKVAASDEMTQFYSVIKAVITARNEVASVKPLVILRYWLVIIGILCSTFVETSGL